MKILLVSPCPLGEQRHNAMYIPQLTLPLIAGMTPEEHEVHICEEVAGNNINYDGDYDIIGITLMTQTCIRGYEIAEEFKKRGKSVIFGGIHASVMPQESIKFGDIVCIGELDTNLWKEILNDIKYNRTKEFYKLKNPPDLQNEPKPKRDLIKCRTKNFSVIPIETSRGCPYECDFCSVSQFFGTKQRHKPIRSVIEDAESCEEEGLIFVDDNITSNRKYAKKLFSELIPLRKFWVGQASVKLTNDKELMQLAHKSGCRALLIGFESFTADGAQQYRKTLKTLDENVLAVKRLRDNGILTWASLIYGLDTDTEDIFDLSKEFINKSKVAFFQPTLATPYPGTALFKKLSNEGRILTDNWSHFDTTKIIIEPKRISPERLLESYNKFRREVFNNSSFLKRTIPNATLGFKEALMFFSVNYGINNHQKKSSSFSVQRNHHNHEIDFDVTKYIMPHTHRTNL